jgi:hypothetical protein
LSINAAHRTVEINIVSDRRFVQHPCAHAASTSPPSRSTVPSVGAYKPARTKAAV